MGGFCFRPLSGIQFSLRIENNIIAAILSFRPLSGIQFSLQMLKLNAGRTGVSVPSRGFNSHYKTELDVITFVLCFRPLSGIQFSLPVAESDKVRAALFPSPLGDSILITRKTWSLADCETLFPSPLGDSILITQVNNIHKAMEVWFPSPLGDSILITHMRISLASGYHRFRPLSGIQFSLLCRREAA